MALSGHQSNKNSLLTIAYSPRSHFLQTMRDKGLVLKKSPRVESKRRPKTYVTCAKMPSNAMKRGLFRTCASPSRTQETGTSPLRKSFKNLGIRSTMSPARSRKSIGIDAPSPRPIKSIGTDPPTFRPRKTVGTDPCSFRADLRKTRDVGTDPPSFTHSPTEQIRAALKNLTNANSTHLPTKPHIENRIHTLDIYTGLARNEFQGRNTFDCPTVAIMELKEFRKANWKDCYADLDSFAAPPSCNTCTHEYALKNMVVPEPTKCNKQGQSLCNNCELPVYMTKKSKHQMTVNSTKEPHKKVTFKIPDPRTLGSLTRTTVESRNKISAPSVSILKKDVSVSPRRTKFLSRKPCMTEVKGGRKAIRHTINCKHCKITPLIVL